MHLNLQVLQVQRFVHPIGPNPTPQHSHRVTYKLRWIRSQPHLSTDLGVKLAHIDTQLTTLIDSYLEQQRVQPHDLVGVILEIEGDERRYGRTTNVSENPLQVLFDYIRALLQANEVLTLKTWVMTVDIFRNPTGGVQRPTSVRRGLKPSFLLEVQEVDEHGRAVAMSDDSESESDGDLSDFIVSDGYLSADEEVIQERSSLARMSDTEQSPLCLNLARNHRRGSSQILTTDHHPGEVIHRKRQPSSSPKYSESKPPPPKISKILAVESPSSPPPPNSSHLRPTPSPPPPPPPSKPPPPPPPPLPPPPPPPPPPPHPLRRTQNLSQAGRIKANSLQHVASKKARRGCVISIDNPNDQLCMYRAVVVAKAHREWQEAKERKKDAATIQSLHREYIALRRIQQAPKVNRMQETAARTLQQSVQGAAPASFDDVLKVARYLQRNIVVLNLDMQGAKPRNVQFQTRSIQDFGWQTTLLVYLEVRISEVLKLVYQDVGLVQRIPFC